MTFGDGVNDLGKDIIDERAAASFLGLSRITLIRKRNDRKLGFYRVGTRILYSKSKHLLPFLALHEQTPVIGRRK